jgi:8-oxo-dGTP diphosphatase
MTEGHFVPGMQDATLCFLLRGVPPCAVLLGYKKRGFGMGKWAGIGGRIEEGEGVIAAACREVCEEIGVTIAPADMQARGLIAFSFPHHPAWNQRVHIFVATAWQGDPAESEEMRPVWYAPDALPFAQMWDDARYWLPQVMAGEPVHLLITFGEDNATVSGVVEHSPLI